MKNETVVLLHGITHSRWNMWAVERALQKAGYRVVNLSYPSRKQPIKHLAEFIGQKLHQKQVWENAGRVHFVTHSMGGLVARQYLQDSGRATHSKMGRVVMIAPPLGGSEIADMMHNWPLYKFLFGPAGQELGTAQRQQDNMPVPYELGVIAAELPASVRQPHYALPLRHDGKVSVAATKAPDMRDHIILCAGHILISWQQQTMRQIVAFLKNGAFDHGQ